MQEPPSNYCAPRETPLPDDQTFKVAVDISTAFLGTEGLPDDIPTQIDPTNPGFGAIAAGDSVRDDSFNGFAIIEASLSNTQCSLLPVNVPGLVNFEILHLAFRTVALFKVPGQWGEIPGCDLTGG